MEIKNDIVRSQSDSRASNAAKNTKSKKKSQAAGSESSLLVRGAKALGIGLLAVPLGAAARPMHNPAALALPSAAGNALNVPAHTGRSLLTACDCTFTTSATNAYVIAGGGYSQITLAPNRAVGSTVIFPGQGSTSDVYGFTSDDLVAIPTELAGWDAQLTAAGSDTDSNAIIQWNPTSAPTANRVFVQLHGYSYAQAAALNPLRQNPPAINIDSFPVCSTTNGNVATVMGGCNVSPPPTPVATIAPIILPPFTPSPTFTPAPTSTPSPTFTPAPTQTPSPTFTPAPTQTPSPTQTPGGQSNQTNNNKKSDGISGAAIGGAAGGVVAVGGAVTLTVLALKRRKAAQMAQREANVEMGAPQPAPEAPATGAPRANDVADFEFTA